mgnify:CR=1 FL=1
MIITRSPLRISFAGGGTDIPQFYGKHDFGAVVSTSINRYVYITLNEKFDGKVSVRYRVHENVDHVSQLKHPLIKQCLLHYGIETGVEVVIISEVPARGSGLGASSALASALCLALDIYTGNGTMAVEKGTKVTILKNRIKVAEIASNIEIKGCGSPIGKQDHYASAVGGFNLLRFNADESVEIKPIHIDDDFYKEIEDQSMLFYLDIEHEYSGGSFVQKILREQISTIEENIRVHILQRDNAIRMMEHMEYQVIERFMDHINENWRLKKMMHGDISNNVIDGIIQKAYSAGATCAKVCGAGGGGFLYLMVPPSMQEDVRKAMGGLHELHFKFDKKGVECLYAKEK